MFKTLPLLFVIVTNINDVEVTSSSFIWMTVVVGDHLEFWYHVGFYHSGYPRSSKQWLFEWLVWLQWVHLCIGLFELLEFFGLVDFGLSCDVWLGRWQKIMMETLGFSMFLFKVVDRMVSRQTKNNILSNLVVICDKKIIKIDQKNLSKPIRNMCTWVRSIDC